MGVAGVSWVLWDVQKFVVVVAVVVIVVFRLLLGDMHHIMQC